MSTLIRPSIPEPGGSERLAALLSYDILDTPPARGFDDIVALASQICDVPVALVSFVAADRQWFKARVGFEPCQTPLDQSVCAHALLGPDLLVIPDLTLDPRTRTNTLVTGEPRMRFYAGAPLTAPGGETLGTLCVIDRVPRPGGLSAAQADGLRSLARQVVDQLELRRALATRDAALKRIGEAESRHRQVLSSAVDYAIVTLDLDGCVTGWSAGAERILGWTEAEMLGRSAHVFFTPADVRDGIAEREMRGAREDGRGNDERWHVRKDGTRFWALGEMMPLWSDAGAHVGYLKMLRDRTEQRRHSETLARQTRLLQTVTDHLSEAVFQLDLGGRVVFANPAAGEMLGWSAAELLGLDLHDAIHHHHADGRLFPREDCALARAYSEGAMLRDFETVFFRRDGTPVDVLTWNAPVIEDGAVKGSVLSVQDVTERRRAERQLRISEERLTFAFAAAGTVGWWDWDVPADRCVASAVFARLYAVDPAAAAAGVPLADFLEGLHPDNRDVVGAAIEQALASAGDFAAEYRLLGADGAVRWVFARGRCFHDAEGCPSRFPGVALDITERKRGEARQDALVALGERLRDLGDPAEIALAAAEVARDALGLGRAGYGTVDEARETVTIDRDCGDATIASMAGVHGFQDYGRCIADLRAGRAVAVADVGADPRTAGAPDALHGLGTGAFLVVPLTERGRFVAAFHALDASPRDWPDEDVAFLRGVADSTRAALARRRAEEEQDLLNREIGHRMKNLLTMVQAIAVQTLRSATDMGEARTVLSGRLVALGAAQDLLLGGGLAGTTVGDVVRSALGVHLDGAARLDLHGPTLGIGARPALSLALMLHELATNAVKYGALSNGSGTVTIAWEVDGATERPEVRFTWRESGGPPVVPPGRKGFGSRFIERGFVGQVGGRIALRYLPSGFTCELTAPVSGLVAEE